MLERQHSEINTSNDSRSIRSKELSTDDFSPSSKDAAAESKKEKELALIREQLEENQRLLIESEVSSVTLLTCTVPWFEPCECKKMYIYIYALFS